MRVNAIVIPIMLGNFMVILLRSGQAQYQKSAFSQQSTRYAVGHDLQRVAFEMKLLMPKFLFKSHHEAVLNEVVRGSELSNGCG